MQTVSQWLDRLGLVQYAEAFAAQEIDVALLPELTDADLQSIGVALLGHRKRLMKAIDELKSDVVIPATHLAHPVASLAETESLPPAGERRHTPRPSTLSLAPEGERRQLTVLFCDMVGFTELANRVDPEILQGIIRSYEDTCAVCITRFEGYVFQRLGDGIVAFFGYPLAHEGEAERAIHAGLAIIESLSRLEVPEVGHLRVRVGIATGLVVVASVEKGAVGDTMNLAARLQGIAQPGSVVVSEQVYRLAGGSFDYEELGDQTLKGVTRRTPAFRIVGVGRARSRFEAACQGALTPLVGREHELSMLLERWKQAQSGEGQVVLLCAEPGIGKSRILSALREQLAAQDAKALRLQCSPYYVNSALWPSIQNFERALRFDRDESYESRLDKLEALMVGDYRRPQADVRFIAAMLSIPCEERYGAISITPQKHKDETLRCLVDMSAAAAHRRPCVMLWEDVHWADPTSLELLDLMIDRVRSMPLLIVLTHRPEFRARWLQHGHVMALNLPKLTRTQSSAMVARVTGSKALPPNLLDQILTKTDGVPLFVEELTKSILESGELKEMGDHYEYVGSSHHIAIPATLRDSLMARLDRFIPVKEIAQIGAVIGREFSHELISAVAPLPPSEVADALDRLTESGLAFRRGTPPEASYTFKHALVQDAAYDSLLKSRRQDLHARIARIIDERFPAIAQNEPEVLARHYTQGGQLLSAIPLWRKAGEVALGRMALAESISHLKEGLALLETLPRSAERDASELALRVPLGTASQGLKGWWDPEVWTSLHPALALAKLLGRNDALLPILTALAFNVLTQGRIAEAYHWVNETLETARATGDPDLLVAGHMIASCYYFFVGRPTEVLEHAAQVEALYDGDKHGHLVELLNIDPKTMVGCYAAICTWILGYPDRAVQLSDQADAHARQRAHPFNLGWALHIGAHVFEFRNEPEKLRQRTVECDQLGRENSLPLLWATMAPEAYRRTLVREGKPAEGVDPQGLGPEALGEIRNKIHDAYTKAVLAEGLAHTGRIDEALGLIDEQTTAAEQPGRERRIYYAEFLRIKGWILSRAGDVEGAERSYLASLAWARTQQAKSWELRTSCSLARLWQAQGRGKEAHAMLMPVYRWFTEGFDTKELQDARALLDALAN